MWEDLTDSEWARALQYVLQHSQNALLKLLQYTYIHRKYLTLADLQVMYLDMSLACLRCKAEGEAFGIWCSSEW